MKKQVFPIGVQSFSKLRENDYLYVDKTADIYHLVNSSTYLFLARPRRFGKSLLLSTISALFQGHQHLFEGLWIEKKWDWTKTAPVIHLSLNVLNTVDTTLTDALKKELLQKGLEYGVTLTQDTVKDCFQELIQKVCAAKGQVVILIDEYDKPIIDYLSKTEQSKAFQHQKVLKNFYSVIKDNDAYIRLLLITGVSKFSKVGIFSDLNNLEDISLSPQFSRLLGWTQEEVDHYLMPYLPSTIAHSELELEALKTQIKEWYNGYSWDGRHYVYNPFSMLLFFKQGLFQNFWFDTGTPTFLIELMKERFVYDVRADDMVLSVFNSYDLNYLELVPLLFQTGYLTIKRANYIEGTYHLDYPNKEVKQSMLNYLLGAFRHESRTQSYLAVRQLRTAFEAENIEEMVTIVNSLFNRIPHQIFIANKEAYYHSVLFVAFEYLDLLVQSEVSTSRGRIDAVVETDNQIFILEFKLDRSAEEVIQQIRDRGYHEPYRNKGKAIIGVGINFSSERKSVTEYLTWRPS